MLSNVNSNIFLSSNSIEMVPVVSAEWNQNLFNAPYITVAGPGGNVAAGNNLSLTSGTVTTVTGELARQGFTTKSFNCTNGKGSITYSVTGGNANAYKIVLYVKTNTDVNVMVSSYAKGTATQYGSAAAEVNSFGWTKIVTYMGSSGPLDTISSFNYTLSVNRFSTDDSNPTVYYTVPEVYATTLFDYKNGSLFPTESPFSYFRPGESYVETGDSNYSFPANFRKVNTKILSGYTEETYSPVSPIIQNPRFSIVSNPIPILKNAMPNDMAPYKYFVSDEASRVITAIYDQNISANKLVLKFNTLMTTPTISIDIDGVGINVDGSSSITLPPIASLPNANPNHNGVLVLYWTGTGWTKNKWSTMPKFNPNGTLSNYTSFKKITVTQTSKSINADFTSYSTKSAEVVGDLNRMHLIEVSPRLEVNLSDFVKEVSINKSLDSKNNFVPISSINTDDATIVLSAIPILTNNSLIPLFSSQSNLSINILSNMLRKNIKFYINFNVKAYYTGSTRTDVNTYVPGGVFYSDSWNETDIKDVNIQCFDITRYLQTTPAPDYVANLKSVFDVITNILDLAGFTDYDYDSLYSICNSKTMPLDLSYFFVNSKDTTIIDALAQIFLAYQIGAYIDEYGVMKFKSLADILASKTSNITISDSNIIEGGYSISNKAKPGKIALRYQSPKIKQSLALQNATNADVKASPSFIYTTSNDVVWQQQNLDSVGFNYLDADMLEKDNAFKLNVNDTLDIFHTYSLNNNGYAVIEDEIVSFVYKEYGIENESGIEVVSVKNDLELSSEINRFTKKYQTGLTLSTGHTKADYNVGVTPTGYITQVERGLFGTAPSDHKLISTLSGKVLTEAEMLSDYSVTATTTNTVVTNNNAYDSDIPSVQKIATFADPFAKTLVYPTNELDTGYKTYSVKFDLIDQPISVAGLFFGADMSDANGTFFAELIRYNQINPTTNNYYSPPSYKYVMALYQGTDVQDLVIGWADVTGIATNIVKNFEKILVKVQETPTKYGYITAADQAFHLKVVHYPSETGDGEATGELVSVFLNNVEITGWQIPGTAGETSSQNWTSTDFNEITKRRKKLVLQNSVLTGSKFGFYSSPTPVAITGVDFPILDVYSEIACVREIYATKKPLKERSVNYFYQDREFLNGLIQNQNVFSNSSSYMMQTNPEVVGLNLYDVQYTTPAAVSVDVLPIEYLWYYFPGTQPTDQSYYQKQLVDEYSLSYSTPINTGFRARMAIVNNSSHMVYLNKQSDNLNQFTVNLNLWTHEIIAPSDPEIIEHITDPSNMTEVAQIDSQWIQSKEAANKMLAVIAKGFDGFSKDTSISIFGNPLIQVGDVITITYSLAGINQQKYLVHSVSQTFSQGLKTSMVLNQIDKGTMY